MNEISITLAIVAIIVTAVTAFKFGEKSGQSDLDRAYQQAFGESKITDPGPLPNIDNPSNPNLHWLASRTHFNTNGTVIVGYDMFLAAVREVDRMAGELQACREELETDD